MTARLFVITTRYWSGLTTAKSLSTVNRNMWPKLTFTENALIAKITERSKGDIPLSNITQPQYAVSGQTTKPTDRSARAIDTRMTFDGDDRSFLSGSFQTANKTRTLPSIIIGAMTIETTELVAERGFTFSRRSHASCKACLLVMFQRLKWPTTAAITQSVLRLHHSPLVTWTQPALYTLYYANVTFSVIFSFFKSDNAWCQLYDLHFDLRKIIYIDRFYGSLLALDLTCVSIRKALLSVQFFHFCVVVPFFWGLRLRLNVICMVNCHSNTKTSNTL